MARVFFVNRFFYPDHSATSQLLTDLAFELGGEHQVQIICSRQRIDDPKAELAATECVRGVEIVRVWSLRFGRGTVLGRGLDYATFYMSVWRCLSGSARRGDIVVAMTDPPLISVLVAWLAKRRGLKLVNWLHDLFPEVAERLNVRLVQGVVAELLRRARNWSLRTAVVNVVLGKRMAGRVEAQGVDSTRVVTIPNWCDATAIKPIPTKDHPLRKQWALESLFVVGYSGNFGLAHEFDTIVKAAQRIGHNQKVVFLFIGDGQRRTWLEAETRRRELTNVVFKPYQPRTDLALSLTVPDVHLVTLRAELEGLIVPSKLYGALAAGRPVISIGSKSGEVARVITEGRCGVAIQSGDVGALVDIINNLYEDRQACRNLATAARHTLESRYTTARALASWCKLIGRVANAPLAKAS